MSRVKSQESRVKMSGESLLIHVYAQVKVCGWMGLGHRSSIFGGFGGLALIGIVPIGERLLSLSGVLETTSRIKAFPSRFTPLTIAYY